MTSNYHDPVLLKESVDELVTDKNGIYVDATMGGGGHTREILRRLGESGSLFGFDQDEAAIANAPADERFTLVRHNYRHLKRFMRFYDAVPVDGILADLGVSSHQFDVGERGFSIRFDGPLDMRMNRFADRTAADVVNGYSEQDLLSVFSEFGEIKNSKTLARNIVQSRQATAIYSTFGLRDVAMKSAERGNEQQYLARVFQALRIEVNDELGALKEFIMQSGLVLRPGGKLVVIAYHSLEDRLVKHYFTQGRFEGEAPKDIYGNVEHLPFAPQTRKPVEPGEEDKSRNPRARSAKMRIGVKQ